VRSIAPVGQLQVVQRSLEAVEFRYTAPRDLSAAEEAAIIRMLVANLGHPFRVSFARMDAIPRSPGGKFEDFICEVPAPARAADGG